MNIKKLSIILAASSVFSCSYALNTPVNGLYFGGNLGGTFAPNISNVSTPILGPTATATLIPRLGGTGGLSLGYRFKSFRAEAQVYGTYDKVHKFTSSVLGGFPNSTTDVTGSLHTQGAIMLNAYFDYLHKNSRHEYSPHLPHLGIGIGKARVGSKLALTNKASRLTTTLVDKAQSVTVGQLIVGYSQFLDDFTTIGIDYRLHKYGTLSTLGKGFIRHSINLTFNAALDKVFSGTIS